MRDKRRFTDEELEKMQNMNYGFVTNTSTHLNHLKGYEVGYSNPRKGVMIVNFNGQNYLVDIEPIGKENTPLSDVMKEYQYIFKD